MDNGLAGQSSFFFTSATKNSKRGARATVSQKKSGRGRISAIPEGKHYSLGSNLVALTNAPTVLEPANSQILTLNNIGQGDGPLERTGIQIQARRLEFRIKVAVDPNSDASNANIVADAHLFRVTIYLDRVPSGGSPIWKQIMDDIPNGNGQEYAFPTLYFRRRFTILADKFVKVGKSMVVHDGATFHTYGNFAYLDLSIPLSHSTWYSDGSTGLAAIQEGNIGVFISSDASATSYPKMKYSWRSRLMFVDPQREASIE